MTNRPRPAPVPAVTTGPAWMANALCRTFPEEWHLWFPDVEVRGNVAEACRVCARCPVRTQCLEYALSLTGPHTPRGVWGGTTTAQRRAIRRQRRDEQAA